MKLRDPQNLSRGPTYNCWLIELQIPYANDSYD